jgi:deoxyribodipyrimidine photo-lyase
MFPSNIAAAAKRAIVVPVLLFASPGLRRIGAFVAPARSLQQQRRPITATRRLFSAMAVLENETKVQHVANEFLPDWFKAERTRVLNHSDGKGATKKDGGAVVYWMQRDVRTVDNWALLLAAHFASTRQVPLHVVYAVQPPPPVDTTTADEGEIPDLLNLPMTERHGKFLLGGLECVQKELADLRIPLHVVLANSHERVGEEVCMALAKLDAHMVIVDFSPLRHFREWIEVQAKPILSDARIDFYQVDAHNVVPVWQASNKREYGARTIRPKIHKQYGQYLQKFPKLKEFDLKKGNGNSEIPEFKRKLYEDFFKWDDSVTELDWCKPGTDAALKQAEFFFTNGLKKFEELRNNPNEKHVISNLSPWINHGHVSFQRLAMAVQKLNKYGNGTAAYIEEGIVRRELSDNYCFYAPNDYDSLTAAYEWAQETLQEHANDPREYIYSLEEFARGETHDDLWNAAQLQAVQDGKMHGFLRMYWAKKVSQRMHDASLNVVKKVDDMSTHKFQCFLSNTDTRMDPVALHCIEDGTVSQR